MIQVGERIEGIDLFDVGSYLASAFTLDEGVNRVETVIRTVRALERQGRLDIKGGKVYF